MREVVGLSSIRGVHSGIALDSTEVLNRNIESKSKADMTLFS